MRTQLLEGAVVGIGDTQDMSEYSHESPSPSESISLSVELMT